MSSQLTFLRHQIDVLHIKVTYYTNTESIPVSIYTQTHTYKTHSVEQKNLELYSLLQIKLPGQVLLGHLLCKSIVGATSYHFRKLSTRCAALYILPP